jgi:hypothetical protein
MSARSDSLRRDFMPRYLIVHSPSGVETGD